MTRECTTIGFLFGDPSDGLLKNKTQLQTQPRDRNPDGLRVQDYMWDKRGWFPGSGSNGSRTKWCKVWLKTERAFGDWLGGAMR